MTYDPGQDSLAFAGRHLTDKMVRMYDSRLTVSDGPTREIELVKCPYLGDAAKTGIDGLRICEAHESWWDVQTRSLSEPIRTRITRRIRDGAATCLVLLDRAEGREAR